MTPQRTQHMTTIALEHLFTRAIRNVHRRMNGQQRSYHYNAVQPIKARAINNVTQEGQMFSSDQPCAVFFKPCHSIFPRDPEGFYQAMSL